MEKDWLVVCVISSFSAFDIMSHHLPWFRFQKKIITKQNCGFRFLFFLEKKKKAGDFYYHSKDHGLDTKVRLLESKEK